jgi:plasmid stability protein
MPRPHRRPRPIRQFGGTLPARRHESDDIALSSPRVAQLLVRHLDDDVKAKLQERARRHGRSTEEEVREILRNAVREERSSPTPLGTRIAARFAGVGLDKGIPELSGEAAEPAVFPP